MLVELSVVEQRYSAVREVLDDGATVVDVACRNGVTRQTVHEWLRNYAAWCPFRPVSEVGVGHGPSGPGRPRRWWAAREILDVAASWALP